MTDCPRCGFLTHEKDRREVPPHDWECADCAESVVVGLEWGRPYLRVNGELQYLSAEDVERLLHELRAVQDLA